MIKTSEPCNVCYSCQVCVECEIYGPRVRRPLNLQPPQPPPQPIPPSAPISREELERMVRDIVVDVLTELGLMPKRQEGKRVA